MYSMNSEIEYHFNNSEVKRTFIIPVGELSDKEAEKNIREMMESYKENVIFTNDINDEE